MTILLVLCQRQELGWLVAERSDAPVGDFWGFTAFSRQPPNLNIKL